MPFELTALVATDTFERLAPSQGECGFSKFSDFVRQISAGTVFIKAGERTHGKRPETIACLVLRVTRS